MEKGKIKIKKNGTAAINKKIAVSKLFDLSEYIPESGSVTLDCEFEKNENNAASRIIINGTEIGENDEIKKDKEKKQLEKDKKAAVEKLKLENEKKYKALKSLKDNNFVDVQNSFVPMDTAEVLFEQEYLIDNFNLELNKLPRYEKNDKKFKFNQQEEKKKGEIIKPFYTVKNKFSIDLISQIIKNEKSNAKSLFKNDDLFKIINFKPNWRLIVGLGGESVYETSITLHHIYGIPYIPASSIKGVVRSWIINSVFGDSQSEIVPTDEKDYSLVNAEFRAYQNAEFCNIFGCPAEYDKVIFENGLPKTKMKNGKEVRVTKKIKTKLAQLWIEKNKKFTGHIGKIIFLDAFPTTEPKIEVDIMNPHYPKYYSGEEPPTDTQNPVPIPFLTVAKTDFQFIIGAKSDAINELQIQGKSIVDWLKEALSVHGIGAKTAVGYGRMKQ